jgi:GMP synthase-like glutamine amidotransferase
MTPILVFQHVPHEHPGLLFTAAREQGISLQIIELWKPYAIPTVTDFSALIVLGGPAGVYEADEVYPSKQDELVAIRSALDHNVPYLGICLGSQLLAHTLGADVYPNKVGGELAKEIGYYDVELTKEGEQDPLFTGMFSTPNEPGKAYINVLQWHGDAFDLPDNAILLATSPLCSNQAFRYGTNAYGLLFHLECTPEMIAKQMETDRDWTHFDFDLNEGDLLRQAHEKAVVAEEQARRLFQNFMEIIARV